MTVPNRWYQLSILQMLVAMAVGTSFAWLNVPRHSPRVTSGHSLRSLRNTDDFHRQQRRSARLTPAVTSYATDRTKWPPPAKATNAHRSQKEQALQPDISDLAIALQRNQSEHVAGSRWSRQQLAQVIRGYLKTKNYAKAEEMIGLHIKLFEKNRFDMQVTMIKIWLHKQRPRHALSYIKKLYPTCLSTEDKQQLQKLGTYAKKRIDSGVAEENY